MSSSSSDSEIDPINAIAFGILLFAIIAWVFVLLMFGIYLIHEIFSVYKHHGKAGEPKAPALREAWQILIVGLVIAVWVANGGDAPDKGVLIGSIVISAFTFYVLHLGTRLDPPIVELEADPRNDVDPAELDSYLRPFSTRDVATSVIKEVAPSIPFAVRSRTPFREFITFSGNANNLEESTSEFQDIQSMLR